MRHIGNLQNETAARTFADHLVADGIRNEVERDTDGTWLIWILDEDQVTAAQDALARFRADPNAAEFRGATSGAEKARATEAAELEAYRRRVKSRGSLFPKFGGHGIGFLTYALVFACLIVAYFSKMGDDREFLRHLYISDPETAGGKFLPEVFAGEVWRLWTPIFAHGSLMHLLFNMLWLFQLGCMIEGRQSAGYLAALVCGSALISNLAQYHFHGAYFVGMSGVVYGLAAYAWIRGKYDPTTGVGLDQQSAMILLIWFVVCYAGLIPRVANPAHLGGLLTGLAWGRIAAYFALRRPK